MESFIADRTRVTKDLFDDIADRLLNRSYLKCKGKMYRICEIEFYFLSKDHQDSYTHGNPDQMRYARWYFHCFKNGSFKEGTYKGVDLTLGNKKEKEYCGILIRSLYDIKNKKMIEGPCRCVNEIIGHFDCEKVKEFMKDKKNPLSCFRTANNRYFYVRDTEDLDEEEIYTTERIGLSDKYPDWRDVHYRYLTKKNMIKKGKKNIKLLEV